MAIEDESADSGDIAIVGMAARFPGGDTLDRFWETIGGGVDAIRDFSAEALIERGVDPAAARAANYVTRGAVIDGIDLFDAAFFGFSPREAELLDPQHRLFLECAWEALERSGHDRRAAARTVGVYAGTSLSTYLLFNLLEVPAIRQAPDTFPFMVGNDKDFLSTRVSYLLNLRGPSLDVQTGCSTSLVAVHLACEGLISCQCDVAIAGGVSVNVPQRTGYHFHEGGVTSPDGRCRPFDAAGRGTIFGSGAGVVVLKRVEDAIADGDAIHAVIKGSAINNDGSSKVGYTAPSVEGQAEVIARAQAVAGVTARDITYVETHGTGTALGDPVEIEALTKAFRTTTDARGFCAIGAVKANIGHLDAAAGVAGLIKTVLALERCTIPPLANFAAPNPEIDFAASPFYVPTAPIEWPAGPAPRRAGVSSFGIGGTNAHLILEEAPALARSDRDEAPQVLVLSARTAPALEATKTNLAAHLQAHPDEALADVAYTLQIGRQAFAHRAALVTGDALSFEHGLPGRWVRPAEYAENRPVVFLLPGQGAQHVRMGQDLYRHHALFREEVDRCCRLVAPVLGRDLRSILYPTDVGVAVAEASLRGTDIVQPALFVIEYALAQLWMHWGVRPAAMLGHSIGEIVAACLAGVFDLSDALRLVVLRGRLMESVAPGAMLAVALPESDLAPLLAEGSVCLAARNHPRQCVLSGPVDAIDDAEKWLASRGTTCHRLAVSRAFHSAMMAPILAAFEDQVARLRLQSPAIPFVSNVTGTWITAAEATDPRYWARHLRSSVRFAEGVTTLMRGAPALLEVGPGHTLTSLVRTHPDRRPDQPVIPSLGGPHDREPDTEMMTTALAQLWTSGVAVDWSALHAGKRRRRVVLPTYPFERQRYWVEPRREPVRDAERKADVADWFYTPTWTRTLPVERAAAIEARPWLVFGDERALTMAIVRGLKQAGHDPVTVVAGDRYERVVSDRFRIRADDPGDYARLLDALADAGRTPDRVIHLWTATDSALGTDTVESGFARVQTHGLYSLLHLVKALVARSVTAAQLWVVGAGLYDVTGCENLRPALATLAGLCDVVSQELPAVACRIVDVDLEAPDAVRLADAIVAETTSRAPARRVAYRGTQRWLPGFDRVHLDAPSDGPFRADRTYVIAGGLGAIGLTLAEYLATVVRSRLVLLHRAAFPARTEWRAWIAAHGDDDSTTRTIRRLEAMDAHGHRIHLVRAELGDRASIAAALKDAEARFGSVHGVIHAAGVSGVAAFAPLDRVDAAECERHFRAKAHGLQQLDEALGDRVLDFRFVFSSNAAILGGPGLLGYAAAHRYMDAFAAASVRRPGREWLAVDWDAWVAGSGEPRSAGRHAVTPAEGIDALRRVLARTQAGQVIVSSGDLPVRIAEWLDGRTPAARAAETGVAHARPALDVAYLGPQNDLEGAVAGIWQRTLGLEQVGVNDNFFELGGNSLLGAEIIAQVKQTLGFDVPIVRLFEQPTVRTFAASLADGPADPQAVAAPRSARGERRRGLLQQQRERYREHA